jgi:hypothetical protein
MDDVTSSFPLSGETFSRQCAFTMAVLLLLSSPSGLAGEGKDKVEKLMTGKLLPALSGQYLTGRKAVLPEASSGRIALLALGFTYDSRFAVEAWSTRFHKEFSATNEITFYEVPMISGMARLARWFIDSGMRKGTPKELHENVITVYGGTDPWKQRLGFKKDDDAYLILIDPDGIVRWTCSGQFDEARFVELADLVRKLVAEISAAPNSPR